MCHIISLFMVSTLLLNLVHITTGETVYFSAAPDDDQCPDNMNCHSINQYTNYTSNSIYYLLEGNHTLEGSSLVTLTALENVTFQGKGKSKDNAEYPTVKQTDVRVICTGNSGFLFDHSTDVVVRNVTILNCGGYLSEDIVNSLESMSLTRDEIGDKWMKFRMALFFIETTVITLDHVSIQHSKDYGLVTANAYNLTVTHSSFAFSNIENYDKTCIPNTTEADDANCFGGNALLFYSIPIPCSWPFEEYKTIISSSNFSYGYDSGSNPRYSGSGLNIYMEQRDAFGVTHIIENVVLYNNTGQRGANFRYTVAKDIARHSLKISGMNSSHGNHFLLMSDDFLERTYGAGIYINIGISGRRNRNSSSSCFNGTYGPNEHETTVSIINTVSTHNIGAFGSGLFLSSDDTAENQYCSIKNSTFDSNSGFAGAGMLLVQENNLNYKYILENVSVLNSHKVHLPMMFGFGNIASAVTVRRFKEIEFQNIRILNNPFTGLFLLNSQVYFKGEANVISNNTALYGGGVQVYGDSCIFLQAPVRAFFEQNKALRTGGAAFVQPTPYITAPCFFQPLDKKKEDESKPMNITFRDNLAVMGGDVIYGARLSSCYLTVRSRFYDPAEDPRKSAMENALRAFYSKVMISFIEDNEQGLSVFSSDPFLVCICYNNIPNCSTRNVPIKLFPGGTQTFSMVAVGERDGTAPGFINMEALVNDNVIDKAIYSTSVNCTNVNYTVEKQENVTVNLNFFINQVGSLKNLSITVEVSNCPKGFDLGEEMCDCNKDIMVLPENVTCNQSTTEFWHNGRVWIGYDNSSNCFATSSCYNDYCINKPVSFTIDTQDSQCQYGRTGIGCGRCIEGYSLILGSNECRVCTNNYLALLLLFAFAGIGLVLLLLSLNLTVSFGTINGLILYANIVKITEPFIFPEGYDLPLQIFISWINLDFGISTCFTSNLTSMQKAFLQLVFPFYLWFIMLVIGVTVHFSSRLTQLVGRKIVPVIATLLLLSFMKLLRACFVAWIRVSYTCNGDIIQVWQFDSTVNYLSGEHLALFLITFFIFVLLIIPYTLSIVFSPLIERYLGHFKIFSWWVKLKPFIDAYDGPYRDKYRYWTGLLLLVRVILVPVFTYNWVVGLNLVSLFVVMLLSVMSFTSGLYRHRALDALEIWFLFQVFTVTFLYNKMPIIAFTSVSLALVTFVGIIVFHILYQLNLINKICVTLKQKWSDRAKVKQSIRRNVSAYTRDLLASAQRARNVTSVKVNPKAKYVEEGSWVVNKRETLLRDYDDTN